MKNLILFITALSFVALPISAQAMENPSCPPEVDATTSKNYKTILNALEYRDDLTALENDIAKDLKEVQADYVHVYREKAVSAKVVKKVRNMTVGTAGWCFAAALLTGFTPVGWFGGLLLVVGIANEGISRFNEDGPIREQKDLIVILVDEKGTPQHHLEIKELNKAAATKVRQFIEQQVQSTQAVAKP